MRLKINWDALGITTSVACAIHCALLPIFLTSLPLFGINIIENMTFEYGMIALAFLVGSYALSHGYRKHHHKPLPLILFAIGIVFLLAKQYWHHLQYYFLPPAVIFIVYAHYLNHKLTKVCDHSSKK